MKSFYITLIILLSFSCAQRIKVPINRMISPEAIGGGLEVEYQHIGYSNGSLDFSDGDTDNALLMSVKNERNFFMGLGLVDKLDIFVQVPQESSSRVGAKIQLIGAPEKAKASGHQLAFTLAMGNSQDTYRSTYNIDMSSNLQDYSIIYGYRFNEVMMMYQGVSMTSYRFQGEIKNPTGLSSSTIDYSANNTLGAHAGLLVGAGGIKVKAEFAFQEITWTNTQKKLIYSMGYSITAQF